MRKALSIIVVSFFVIAAIGAAVGGSGSSDEPTRRSTPRPAAATATPDAEEAEKRRKGFHCLSAWDGSHRGFNEQIKKLLNDPGSLEVHETRIAAAVGGKHAIMVDFSAKNALGGRVRHLARGGVDHETCVATLISTNM